MNILVVTNVYPRPGLNAHCGVFVKNEIEAVQRLYPTIHYEVFIIRGRESRLNYLKSIFELRSRLATAQYDLVHAHYGYSCLVAGLSNRSTPLVATFHGSDVNKPSQFPFTRLASCFAKRIIVVNRDFARRFPAQKVTVIPPGIDTGFFQPMPVPEARKLLGLEADVKYILFGAARWRRVKNYPLFRSVVREIQQQHQCEIRELALEGISQCEVRLALNAADLLLLTSTSEGSPQVVKEAMCCNLPIVSVDVGDVRRTISGASLCYVCPYDTQVLARQALHVLQANSRSNGREFILNSDLDLTITAQRVAAVYDEVVRCSS